MRSSPPAVPSHGVLAARRIALALGVAAIALLSPSLKGQGCQANAIVCENQLTGNLASEWDISGSGDGNLQGFATDISVNKGETVHFKVDTTSATFQVDIYRLGYYGGRGARKVAALGSFTGRDQPNCLTNGSTGLIDCGNWTENASWAVPLTAVSGIYIARLSRSGGASHIAFVVRDDAGQADLLFQTSDTTWQAYNTYGGNSLYVGGPGTNPGRAYKVSYNRPFTTRGTGAEDWLFNAEYPMVRWLEANGYNVSYFTGVDTDRYGATELFRHRAFLSVGHDEYWSGQQRTNVEAARAAGVHLAFFSGNEVFWKTRWENSIDGSNTPYRTLVSYKESHNDAKIDPQPTWTGLWRDTRFSPPADGGRPENALTGTIFTVNCCNTGQTIRVTQTYASQPFWRNTRVASLPSGGSTTLTPGVLNYEWDENLNNGSRPAGLTTLASTTLAVSSKLSFNGSTYVYAAGNATHALVQYRHASGALVFGAGTPQWSWGLDGNHDRGGSTPDLAMQQATVNLFADMGGLQPSTLQTGLVPGTTDTTAPTVSLTAPAAGATVTGAVTVSATASDNVGVASVQFTVDGVNYGTPVLASPFAMTWDTTTATNGTHTVAAVAKDATGNQSTSSRTVTVSNTVSGTPPPLSLDAVVFGDRSTSATTIATSALSTTAGNELLLAFVAADDTSASGQQVTGISGGGLTWVSVVRTGSVTGTGQRGVSEIWRAFAPAPVSNAAVTATLAQSAAASITVVSIKGADTTGTNGSGAIGATRSSSAASGGPTGTLTTTRSNSLVFGVGNDWDGATSRTVGAGQTMIHQYLATVGDTLWVQRMTSATPASGTSVTINDTAPTNHRYNLSLVEVRQALASDVTKPTVTISAPAAGANVSGGAVTVLATASDDVGVVGVQFLVDNGALGQEVTASPYSVAWNTALLTNGTHTLSAVARDAAGNNSTAPVISVTVNNGDIISPTVSVSAPGAGATVSGTAVTVSANASDDVGVVGVQFKLDGVNLGAEDTVAPYSIAWDTTTTPNGSHSLTAVARDAVGHSTTSASVGVTLQNVGIPTVSITSPSAGAAVSATITVNATASDSTGIAGVQFKVDGVAVGPEDTTAPYSVSFTATNGSHTLTAVARNPQGTSVTSQPVTVTVSTGASTAVAANGIQTFQTIDGIGVNINSLSWKDGELRPAIDLLADQMGVTSWRVVFDMADWEDPNDNADPNAESSSYYNALYSNPKFQHLWGTLHYLNSKGITQNIALSFMGRVAPWLGGAAINAGSEDEFVETIVSLLEYARNTEHVVFDRVDPINEPDYDGIEGPKVGAAQYTAILHKLAVKLDAVGLNDIKFLGPNTASVTGGVTTYIPSLLADPVVMAKIDHFGLHDYSGSAGGAAAALQGTNRNFWMTEFALPSDVPTFLGQNASGLMVWEAYDSIYNHAILAGRGDLPGNDDFLPALIAYNAATGVYTPRTIFYQFAQFARYIPAGSIRIGTTGAPSGVSLFAFYHQPSGRITIFGRNISATAGPMTISLSNLPAISSMQVYETTLSTNFLRGRDALISNGSLFYTAPVNSYFTLTAAPIANIAVPNVVGALQATATSTITGTSLVVGTVTTQPSTTVAPGLVISQNPAPPAQAPQGSPVNLVISTGVTVPNVVGEAQATATTTLTNASLTVGTVTPQSSASVPSGSVISQSPIASTQVSGGTAMTLVVSTGPVMVAAPDVVGLSQATATSTITGATLVLGTVTTQASTTIAPGVVISQLPLATTQVPQSSAVNIVVSTGVTVPSVVGHTQDAATTLLTNASLAVGTVTSQSSASVPSGSVINQSPVASTQVSGGTAVNLTVSTGPVMVAAPDVIGLMQATATTTITGATLAVGTVTLQASTTAAPGLVIGQNPEAPTQVAQGSAVNLVVSTGVAVPNVVGQTEAAATDAITAASLALGTVTTQSSGSVPSGAVISQSPAASAQVSGGSAVNLVVSTGPVMVAVPDVVGLPQATATTTITGATLVLGTVTQQASTTVAIGAVISQSPALPAQGVQGSAVNLVVSTGVTVPNVVGQTQAAATSALTTASLAVGTITNQSSASVPAGSVISQSPVAATKVSGGSAVNLVTSTGPVMVAAPNVVGLSQGTATSTITGATLVLGTVTPQASTTIAPGVVISQIPVATTQVPQGSAVNLVVSTGVAVPNVVGQAQAAATTALTNASLTVGTVTSQSSASVPAGSVISQSPAASTQVVGGSAVNLVLSTGGPTAKAISVDFLGGTTASPTVAMGSTESAGVVAKANWNNAPGVSQTTGLALVDEMGAATPTTVKWTAASAYLTPITDAVGNRRMMRGYLDANETTSTTVTLTNVAAGTYDVYVYVDGANGAATRSGTYQLSGAGIATSSVTATDAANTNFNATFTQAVNGAGNYVKFTGVAISGDFTITASVGTSNDGYRRAAVNGLQIIPMGPPVPDFTVGVTPALRTISPGAATSYAIDLGALNGFAGLATLSVSGLPGGASASFSPNPAPAGGPSSATLTITTTAAAIPGNAALTITATAGALTHTATATLGITAPPGAARAISVDFVGGTTASPTVAMGSTESAGVVAKTNWNSAPGASRTTGLALVDETGAPTATTVQWTAASAYLTPITDALGNRRMMRGYLDANETASTTVTLANVAAGTYDVYVYVDGANGAATRSGTYQLSGAGIVTATVTATDAANANFNATFTQAVNGVGNYVKFTGVAISSGFTITAAAGTSNDGYRRAPVNGLQIVPVGP